jgi:hypothetical protein
MLLNPPSARFRPKSFAELEAAACGGLLRALEQQIPPPARRLLQEVAPERIRLPGGRQVRVNYESQQPPWIASRLQDFFGMRETPTVARGAVPVVVRLLAPNQRPVQMTSDLAGFWQRLYPQVRKELAPLSQTRLARKSAQIGSGFGIAMFLQNMAHFSEITPARPGGRNQAPGTPATKRSHAWPIHTGKPAAGGKYGSPGRLGIGPNRSEENDRY